LARGTIAPLVTEVLPLEEAAAGIDRLVSGRTTGKLVVRIGEDPSCPR
jgi:NADPH:quinone reductase-like Zn-dependent oxidoreductase